MNSHQQQKYLVYSYKVGLKKLCVCGLYHYFSGEIERLFLIDFLLKIKLV